MRIDELCRDKYIYLDWNVVKNMINPRNDKKELDEEMKRIIYSLRKKYKFPYKSPCININWLLYFKQNF